MYFMKGPQLTENQWHLWKWLTMASSVGHTEQDRASTAAQAPYSQWEEINLKKKKKKSGSENDSW